MVEVHLWSGLRSLTGGQQVVQVQAATTGELLRELTSIAIGQTKAGFQTLPPP